MKQGAFTDIEYSGRKKKTKREEFLEIMDEIIPWDEWVGVIEPYYPKEKRGRLPMGIEKTLRMYLLQIWFNLSETKIVCMPCLPVPICIRWRLPVENFPQHKSRGGVCPFTEKKAANQRKKAYLSKDKPCILKKRLNGVLDQNIGLIIQRFPRIRMENRIPLPT